MSKGSSAASTKSAAEICKKFPLSEAGAKLLREDIAPQPFLELLIDKECCADACRFLAHTMPKRQAIWWAYLCSDGGAPLPPPAAAARQAAEAWVISPSDEKRRAAHAAAQTAGVGTPVGLTCEAIFFSEGSMGPAEYQAVPAPDHLTATTAANAVILAAVAEPARMAARYRQYLTVGKDVAAGKNKWKE